MDTPSFTPLSIMLLFFRFTGYCSSQHLLQTGLHVIQLIVSYILMLVVMTYNVYLCLAIALGAGVGYYLFFRERFVVLGNQECCH